MATIPNVAVPSSQKKPAKKREIQFTEEMDEILKRITEIKNVAGVVVVNSEGITVKSTLDNVLSVQVAFSTYLYLLLLCTVMFVNVTYSIFSIYFLVLRVGVTAFGKGKIHCSRSRPCK